MTIKTGYLASIAGAALVFSAIAGLAGAEIDDNTPLSAGAREVARTSAHGSFYAFESTADYATREAVAIAELNAPATDPASAD